MTGHSPGALAAYKFHVTLLRATQWFDALVVVVTNDSHGDGHRHGSATATVGDLCRLIEVTHWDLHCHRHQYIHQHHSRTDGSLLSVMPLIAVTQLRTADGFLLHANDRMCDALKHGERELLAYVTAAVNEPHGIRRSPAKRRRSPVKSILSLASIISRPSRVREEEERIEDSLAPDHRRRSNDTISDVRTQVSAISSPSLAASNRTINETISHSEANWTRFRDTASLQRFSVESHNADRNNHQPSRLTHAAKRIAQEERKEVIEFIDDDEVKPSIDGIRVFVGNGDRSVSSSPFTKLVRKVESLVVDEAVNHSPHTEDEKADDDFAKRRSSNRAPLSFLQASFLNNLDQADDATKRHKSPVKVRPDANDTSVRRSTRQRTEPPTYRPPYDALRAAMAESRREYERSQALVSLSQPQPPSVLSPSSSTVTSHSLTSLNHLSPLRDSPPGLEPASQQRRPSASSVLLSSQTNGNDNEDDIQLTSPPRYTSVELPPEVAALNCALCGQNRGALKLSDDNIRWAHLVCGWWTKHCEFLYQRHRITGIADALEEFDYRSRECQHCSVWRGQSCPLSCSQPRCRAVSHLMCALRNGWQSFEATVGGTDEIKQVLYCPRHLMASDNAPLHDGCCICVFTRPVEKEQSLLLQCRVCGLRTHMTCYYQYDPTIHGTDTDDRLTTVTSASDYHWYGVSGDGSSEENRSWLRNWRCMRCEFALDGRYRWPQPRRVDKEDDAVAELDESRNGKRFIRTKRTRGTRKRQPHEVCDEEEHSEPAVSNSSAVVVDEESKDDDDGEVVIVSDEDVKSPSSPSPPPPVPAPVPPPQPILDEPKAALSDNDAEPEVAVSDELAARMYSLDTPTLRAVCYHHGLEHEGDPADLIELVLDTRGERSLPKDERTSELWRHAYNSRNTIKKRPQHHSKNSSRMPSG